METSINERWVKLVEEQQRSGQNASAWCRTRGIDAKTFLRWRQKLRTKNDDVELGSFLPVGVSSHIEIEFGSRAKILVSRGFCKETLRAVLEVIMHA